MKITLVGCGLLGSFHLYGIVNSKKTINVQVIEPNKDAVTKAKERIAPVLHDNVKIDFLENISLCDKESDLTIVATLSIGRVKLIKKL
ncbi:hypothetical protein HY745_06360, partial [Candidatus Desantisbacteria bacterium]|nr:hypothetical protein [Candidatus Desantisbacteria bacterium]